MLALLPLLLAAVPVHANAKADQAARGKLEQCARLPINGGTRFTCDENSDSMLVVSVLDLPTASMKMALDGLGLQMAGFLKEGAEVTETKFKHGSRVLEGRLIVMPGAITTWLTFPSPQEVPRMASCTAHSKELEKTLCTPILRFLIDVDGAFFANAAVKPMFGGRPKGVPVNCKVSGTDRAYQVACGGSGNFSATGHESKEAAKDSQDNVVALLIKSLPGMAEKAPERCQVDGETTQCRVIAHTDAVMKSAIVEREGQHLVVACTQAPSYPGFHRVCSDVFQQVKSNKQ